MVKSRKAEPLALRVRRATGLSQVDFADEFRIDLGELRAWESGETEPSCAADTLLRLIELHPDTMSKLVALVKVNL